MRNKFLWIFAILNIFMLYEACAQKNWDKEELDILADRYTASSIDLFMEMLCIPNDSHYPEMIKENIEWFEDAFVQRGFTVQRLETPSVPVLFFQKKVKNAKKTVLFYIHGDGQAVQPDLWDQESPWHPVIKSLNDQSEPELIPSDRLTLKFDPEWRIFARSSSDDKGPLAMFLTAFDILNESAKEPGFDIKVFLDFEEELGSPNLREVVSANKNLLASDMMVIFDGPNHNSNKPTLCFGARGICKIALTTYGAKVALHSGHYGNYSPNPVFVMSDLLSTFKDDNGRVLIPGFYDGIKFTVEERRILENVPDDESLMLKKLGIAKSEKVGNYYQESLQYPSLNIHGIQAGWVGNKATNIIPSKCEVEIDMRIVPESDPERLIGLIKKYIKDKGFYVIDKDPDDEERLAHDKILKFESSVSYLAFRTDIDSEPGLWLNNAMTRAFGYEPVKLRILGGSLPIAPFIKELNIPAVIVPTVNPDNNQHGPNENLRIGNYRDGIKTMLAILTERFD